MPDLTGQFWTDAEPRLRAWGGPVAWTRAPTCRTATENQRGGQSEPVARHRGELRQHDHAEVRVVAAHGVGDLVLGAPAPRTGPCRSRPASWPASGDRPRSGSTRVELHAVDRQLDVSHAHDDAALGAGGDLEFGRHGVGQNRQRVIARRGEWIRKAAAHRRSRGTRCWSCRAAVPARGRRWPRTPPRWPGGPGTRPAAGSRRGAGAHQVDRARAFGCARSGAEQNAVEFLGALATSASVARRRRRYARPARTPSWPRYWTRLNTKLS